MSDESIFSLEQDYSSRTSLNPDFVKEKYDYDVRMFKFDKSLAIQAPTWRMRDTQTIESYMDEFLRNPALATRDFGANPIDAVAPAIEHSEFIEKSFEKLKDFKHPIIKNPFLQPNGEVVNTVFRDDFICQDHIRRYCHVDIGLTQDRLGLAVGHAEDWVEKEQRDAQNRVRKIKEPIVSFDLLASFKGYKESPVQLIAIRQIIFDVIKRGYNIHRVTLDGYQSADFIQNMKAVGMDADTLSIDRTTEPFDELIKAIYEKRINMYPLNVKTPEGEVNLPHKELRQLERDGNKYDHPPGGSHDLIQAIAGVIYTIKTNAKPKDGGYFGYLSELY